MTDTQITTDLLQETIDRFWETIPPTWNHIRAAIQGIVTANFDITVEQFHILRNIRKGRVSISELAEAKHISRPAISQAVDLLVGKGLITRTQSTEDRRYVQLALTDSGDALLNAIFQKNREWMIERLAPFSLEEIETLMRGMEALSRAFGEPRD